MEKVIIIAEAGVNHNGDMKLARQLIDAAAEAGVDYVKFQTFKADKLVTRTAKKAAYQSKNIGDSDDSQYNMLKLLELSHENHLELIDYCNERGIQFFSTAFDVDGVYYLDSLNLPLFKVPSEAKLVNNMQEVFDFIDYWDVHRRNLPGTFGMTNPSSIAIVTVPMVP